MWPVLNNSTNKYTSGHEFKNTSEGFFFQTINQKYILFAGFYKTLICNYSIAATLQQVKDWDSLIYFLEM